jgi:PAS domain S-box-containing protein
MLTALRDEQGQLRGFAKILRDLTERHHAAVERERLLEQVEFERRRLATVLQQMPAGVVIAAAPSGALVLGNPAMERLFGHPFVLVDRVAQYTCYQGLHTDGRAYLPEEWPLARALTQGEEVRDEAIRIPRPDGTQATAWVSASPIRDRYGHIIGAVTVANDVTARQEAAEERGRLLAELQRVNAELQQFASIVSHDLSEPLRAITSFTTLLAQQYHGKLDAAADEYLAFVTDAAQRMQRMLADLLAYRRLGAAVPTVAPVDCETLLAEVLADLRLAVEESQAEITHDPLPTVPGDATRLKHVLQNLLGNALKFRHPAAPPRVHIAARRAEGGWEFAVRDHGIGLDPAQAERIFQVFQRLHTPREYPGTGIGLAICKRIIEQYGGRIWVESQPGQGATFFFTVGETTRQRTLPEQ